MSLKIRFRSKRPTWRSLEIIFRNNFLTLHVSLNDLVNEEILFFFFFFSGSSMFLAANRALIHLLKANPFLLCPSRNQLEGCLENPFAQWKLIHSRSLVVSAGLVSLLGIIRECSILLVSSKYSCWRAFNLNLVPHLYYFNTPYQVVCLLASGLT